VDQVCAGCHGEGRVHADREVTVTVPAGIDDGQQIRVGAEGESGMRGGPPGDLYVLIRLREHDLFRREGDDLIHVLRITPAQAALGDDVSVPTIDGGTANVKVPAGAQHGQSVRLRGKGVPRLHTGGRGDQLVYLQVVIPRSLSKEERALYQKLRAMGRAPEQDEDDGLLGKVRDAFGG
jgi:molecular chaperone DnaJ